MNFVVDSRDPCGGGAEEDGCAARFVRTGGFAAGTAIALVPTELGKPDAVGCMLRFCW